MENINVSIDQLKKLNIGEIKKLTEDLKGGKEK